MVKLAKDDIKTREVLDWKGVHLFHYFMSSCSQKLRIYLNLKGIDWESHELDLLANENISEWYLGINPRGLVPVLVHDGDVHIESNDILLYLEKLFPEPRLIPKGAEMDIQALLHHEDDLHLDFRRLSFRFIFNPPTTPKTPDVIERYADSGSGTVHGVEDEGKAQEIAFWKNYADKGVLDDEVRAAVTRFRAALDDLEKRLTGHPYLLGDTVSILDIAWYIYINRLQVAGYPLRRLHPKVAAWFDGLNQRPEFSREVAMPAELEGYIQKTQQKHKAEGRTLVDVASF